MMRIVFSPQKRHYSAGDRPPESHQSMVTMYAMVIQPLRPLLLFAWTLFLHDIALYFAPIWNVVSSSVFTVL